MREHSGMLSGERDLKLCIAGLEIVDPAGDYLSAPDEGLDD